MTTAEITGVSMFEVTDEHEALRDMLRQFFVDAEGSLGWQRLLTDLGADAIVFGGESDTGATAIDLAILAEEAGAALFGGPLIPAVAVGALAAATGAGDLVTPLRTGSHTAGAVLGAGGGLTVNRTGSSARIDGVAEPVWGSPDPAVVIVDAELDGAGLVALLDREAFHHIPLSGLDLSRSPGRITCTDAVAGVLVEDAEVRSTIARRVDLTISAELLGVAQHVLEGTVAYVDQRVQFGRTVGSFQAVKHRLADLLGMVELARSAVYAAAWQLTYTPDNSDTDIDLAVAAVLVREAASAVTKAAVQLHGGIAITWEHWAHRYLRRAHAVSALTGSPTEHRRRLATLIDARECHCD
ncbi:acyl-CoA dehydrogenase family protein [Mycolicibacterium sp. XJ870]